MELRGEGKMLNDEPGEQPGPRREVPQNIALALGSYGKILGKGVTWTCLS